MWLCAISYTWQKCYSVADEQAAPPVANDDDEGTTLPPTTIAPVNMSPEEVYMKPYRTVPDQTPQPSPDINATSKMLS